MTIRLSRTKYSLHKSQLIVRLQIPLYPRGRCRFNQPHEYCHAYPREVFMVEVFVNSVFESGRGYLSKIWFLWLQRLGVSQAFVWFAFWWFPLLLVSKISYSGCFHFRYRKYLVVQSCMVLSIGYDLEGGEVENYLCFWCAALWVSWSPWAEFVSDNRHFWDSYDCMLTRPLLILRYLATVI